jgi:hypothetical protein
MKLRLFLASLSVVWACSSADAQENVPRIGYLRYTTEGSDSEREWFVQGLRELGWEDGRNIKIGTGRSGAFWRTGRPPAATSACKTKIAIVRSSRGESGMCRLANGGAPAKRGKPTNVWS